MTPIKKIRAEIERLKRKETPFLSEFEKGCVEGNIELAEDLLSFLDTLEAEDYDPYKTTVESILKMFDSYSITTDKEDFIANIRVKCKDAVEYATGKRPVEANEKPAEWSEEDKEMLDFAIRAIGLCRQYAINNQVNGYSKLPDVPKRYEELQNWLKSKLRPQPKQEWMAERGGVGTIETEYEKFSAAIKEFIEAVEQYAEPKPGTPYMHRTKLLAIKNKVKEIWKYQVKHEESNYKKQERY